MFVGAIRPLSPRACQDPSLPAVGSTTDVARKGNLEVPIEQAQCGASRPVALTGLWRKAVGGPPPGAGTSNASLEIGISVFLPG